ARGLGAAGGEQLARRDALAAEQVVRALGGRVARFAGVEHDDGGQRPRGRHRGAQPGGSAADDGDVVRGVGGGGGRGGGHGSPRQGSGLSARPAGGPDDAAAARGDRVLARRATRGGGVGRGGGGRVGGGGRGEHGVERREVVGAESVGEVHTLPRGRGVRPARRGGAGRHDGGRLAPVHDLQPRVGQEGCPVRVAVPARLGDRAVEVRGEVGVRRVVGQHRRGRGHLDD